METLAVMPANRLGVNHYNFVALHSTLNNFRRVMFLSSSVSIPAGGSLVHDVFFSTLPGVNFDMCMISTRTKTHCPSIIIDNDFRSN